MDTQDYVYHWTHRSNVESILKSGIDPTYAEGKLKVVWFCDAERVGWALAHIGTRHGWDHDEMVLIRFPRSRYPFANTAFAGVYTTTAVVSLKAHTAVKGGVLGPWVSSATVRKDIRKRSQTHPDTSK